MATYTSFDQVGKKEDISDVITNLSPTDTPFQTAVKSETVDNTLFQWQEDSLAAPNDDNAMDEGFEASAVTLTPTTMRSNVTQIMSTTVKVSDTADTVSAYGRAKETAYQIAKKSKELKRDLERAFVGTGQAQSVTGLKRKMAGYQAQIDASVKTDLSGGVAANKTALTEGAVLDLSETLYTGGGEASLLMVKPHDSRVIAGWTGAAGRYRQFDGGAKTVTNAVNLYVSPYGELKVVMNRFLRATDALLFDPDHWRRKVLRPWTRTALAKTGDASSTMIVGEFSLKHDNFKASGLITGLL
ncbi:SU10 major capsid protein [Nitrospirillum iridis]|uniref:Head protein n=1 Tax=Nitrospirillum iridis TaxID=765888 RepID=A0A7X0AZL0_9PROT|nr:DUF5309 family protein [Nitrospirillum iridis]MBB6253028.1 hypothetical protein [Nitrospirillum iridis]